MLLLDEFVVFHESILYILEHNVQFFTQIYGWWKQGRIIVKDRNSIPKMEMIKTNVMLTIDLLLARPNFTLFSIAKLAKLVTVLRIVEIEAQLVEKIKTKVNQI